MSQSEDLGKVKAKSLIIVGRRDFVCPVNMAEQVHKGIQGSQLVIFEHTGHIPWIEEPSKFFALVTQFLQS
jgi:proline iminopeptidase